MSVPIAPFMAMTMTTTVAVVVMAIVSMVVMVVVVVAARSTRIGHSRTTSRSSGIQRRRLFHNSNGWETITVDVEEAHSVGGYGGTSIDSGSRLSTR